MAESESQEGIDFDAAEIFLKRARLAHEGGDKQTCTAALKLMAVALCLSEGPNGKLHTGHLARL